MYCFWQNATFSKSVYCKVIFILVSGSFLYFIIYEPNVQKVAHLPDIVSDVKTFILKPVQFFMLQIIFNK